MPLELYRPTRNDARLLADLQFGGYSDDPVSAMMYPVPANEQTKASLAKDIAKNWGKNPHEHALLVWDTELEKFIGWGHWMFEPEKSGEDWKVFKPMDCPPDWDAEFANTALRKNFEKKVEIMGSKPYVYLQTVVTPPQYRRRGAASALLTYIISWTAKHNLPLYLCATPSGFPVYEKHGFQEQSSFHIDVSKVTSEPRINKCMLIRAPSPSSPPIFPPLVTPMTTLEDLAEYLRVDDAAFGPSQLFRLAFGLPDPSASSTAPSLSSTATETSTPSPSYTERAQKELNQITTSLAPENKDDYARFYHKATDPGTGEILGGAKWYIAKNTDPGYKHRPFGPGPWPPGSNVELCEACFGAGNKFRETTMAGEKHVLCCVLVVKPGAQRRGVGGALLRAGLRVVDALDEGKGWRCWIDATPQGAGLYRRLGWQEVHSVTTDLEKWGGVGSDVHLGMVREAHARRGLDSDRAE